MSTRRWETVEEGVSLFRDSCNVYAVRGPEGTVLVNAGTGQAAEHLAELGEHGPITVLLTHHFRDHTDGAIRLHVEAGATVLGNDWDREYYLDPARHFQERQTWNSYDNRWDRFSPIRPLPVAGWMRDYETRALAGLSWEVVPTPGHTNGASSYIVTLPGGRRLAFVGEVLCGPDGKTSRLAPLQYNYNDLEGAVNLWHSAARLREAHPSRLLPSVGEPMDDPAGAIAAFQRNLKRLEDLRPGFAANLPDLSDPGYEDIEEVLPRLWRSKESVAHTHFLIGGSGRVLALDYGYNSAALRMPAKHHLSNRRPLLHGMKGLKRRFGVERIDTVLVTHYHDDHVNGLPMLQRLFGTEVWAAGRFSDLLERPERYDRPCLWHEPIPVARHLPCGETFLWDDIPITLHPMSGHTRFSTLVCLEVDGTRVAHTGDQIFFDPWEGFGPDSRLFTNHVYKNGLDLGCYRETLGYLKQFRPEIVLTGHTDAYRTNDAWYGVIERGAQAFDDVHRALMPLGENDIHFGAESQAGKLAPYRAHLPDGGGITFEGWILNPFPTPQRAVARLVAPEGWESEPVTVEMGPREQKGIRMRLTPPAGVACRRQPVALDLTVGDRPFGQVTEALVTVGLPRF